MKSAVDPELMVEQLATGSATPVLVADFRPFTSTRRIGELLSGRAGDLPVYQIDPLSALYGDRLYIPMRDLAAMYTDAFLSFEPVAGRVFIVGHCSAAALSMHITRMLVASRPVTAILLDPAWGDANLVRKLFAQLQGNLGVARRPCPDLDGEPNDILARMEDIFRDEMTGIVARNGLDGEADVFSNLLVRYRAWMAFLLACSNDEPEALTPGSASVRVLTNADGGTVPGLSADAYEVSGFAVGRGESPMEVVFAELALKEIRGPDSPGATQRAAGGT